MIPGWVSIYQFVLLQKGPINVSTDVPTTEDHKVSPIGACLPAGFPLNLETSFDVIQEEVGYNVLQIN